MLNPGPATTTDSVKYSQVIPDICPRTEEFRSVLKEINKDLVTIAGGDSDYTCVFFGGAGTAGMDAVINSVVAPGSKILIINNGVYGERLVNIAKVYNIDFIELGFKWGALPDLKLISDALDQDSSIAYVAVVHHETTTGLLNPIDDIVSIAKRYNVITILDAMSSFGGLPLDVKKQKIDFMISSSNKCIQAMAGVCFAICKIEELEKTRNYPPRSFYLNLYNQYDFLKRKGELQFTPPVQTIYALKQAVKEFIEEGAENRYNRYLNNWKRLRRGLKDMGFEFLLDEKNESHILLSVLYPKDPNFNFMKLYNLLLQRGFTIYPGRLAGKNTIRFANIGDIDEKDIIEFLNNFKEVLDEMNVSLKWKS